jgi:hypothetical protein
MVVLLHFNKGRLVEFAMHGEEYPDVIKRLLDVAAASAGKAKLRRQQRQQQQQQQQRND